MTDERSHATSLSPWWRHGAILVMIVGFTLLSIVTVATYDNAPPIAARVVDGAGGTIFTRDDVLRGQEVFLKYGLMEHGTLWGHGAYLGPDYTAEYLHRLAEISRDTLAIARHGKPYAALDAELARNIGEAVRAEAKACEERRHHGRPLRHDARRRVFRAQVGLAGADMPSVLLEIVGVSREIVRPFAEKCA